MGVMDCLLCGSCAYVCPAAIPLTQYFDWGKQEINKIRFAEQKTARTCLNSAAAVAGIRRGLLASPVRVATRGGELNIAWGGPGRPVLMTGPAVTVFEGEIEL